MIFLGGTCNDSIWRDTLIPHLDELGINWHNPVVDDWNEEAQTTTDHFGSSNYESD